VPLLKLASEVDVLTIGNTGNDADPTEAADYLARHGCKVTARREAKAGDLPTQLLDAMRTSGATWCVMGSYGHKRLREFLFGGATKTLFAQAPIPLFVSH
jgi:nucleotide-binding universal stress UspA family protein